MDEVKRMIEKLKELRQKKGISQQALADTVGVSQQSINKYENHNIEPDIRTLKALADYFHTSVDYLIGHTEVDHIIEPVQPCELNEEELALVEDWRSLNPEEKRSIVAIIENYLKGRRNFFCRDSGSSK